MDESMRAYVERVVAEAPPLMPWQIARLAGLLRPIQVEAPLRPAFEHLEEVERHYV